MNIAFPDANITNYKHKISELDLPFVIFLRMFSKYLESDQYIQIYLFLN